MTHMKPMSFTITGMVPLLMHATTGLDKTHALSREAAAISSKRKKTNEDEIELQRLDFCRALYFKEGVGPIIPGELVHACIRDAAKITRDGKNVTRGVLVTDAYCPLQYEGPRTVDKLWADERFRDVRAVKVSRASIMRCRPKFENWSITFSLEYDPEVLNDHTLEAIVESAGRTTGIGDYRPRFGRFNAERVAEQKAAA